MDFNNSDGDVSQETNYPTRDKSLTVIFFSQIIDDASVVLRMLGPAQFAGFKVIRGITNDSVQYDKISEADIVVLQRNFPRDLDVYEKIISLAHENGIPVVLDLDDLLIDLPPYHPDRMRNWYADDLLPLIQKIIEVDLVTVTTENMRDHLLPYNSNIVVFQNYLNDNIWKMITPNNIHPEKNQVTIGFMGGQSHAPDILMISPALEKIINKYPQKVLMKFWGMKPHEELLHFSQVEWIPIPTWEYREFASFFQSQSADILIAPLIDNKFNRCKSQLKFLEYSTLGIPGIYSNLPPFSYIIENGVDGLLASSTSEWEEALIKLIEDQELRQSIAQNAQILVSDNWLVSKNAYKLKQIYDDAIKQFSGIEHRQLPIYDILKSVIRQNYDNIQQKNQLLSDKTSKISTLEHQITQLNESQLQLTGQIIQLEKQIALFHEQNAQSNQQIGQLLEQKDQLEKQINNLHEQNNQLNNQNLQLNEQKNNLIKRLEESEDEIVAYVSSTSWKLTRPIRKITKLFRKTTR